MLKGILFKAFDKLTKMNFFFWVHNNYSMVEAQAMDTATQVQILNEAVCISHNASTLGKAMHGNILLLYYTMDK